MKKLLLLVTAFALSLGSACAQNAKLQTLMPTQQLVQKNLNGASARKALGQKKVELGENQLLMGAYLTDEVAEADAGVGLTGFPGTVSIAQFLPVEAIQVYEGGSVVKVRVGLANAASISRVFMNTIDSEGNISATPLFEEVVKSNQAGWSEFELTNPATLDFTGLYGILLGFDYVQTSDAQSYGSYPISSVEASPGYPVYAYGNFGSGLAWYDIGLQNLSVQAFVENENFEKVNIMLNSFTLDKKYYQAGGKAAYSLGLFNFGTGKSESYKVEVALDGNLVDNVEGTEISSMETKQVSNEIALPEDLALGMHTMTAKVVEVNGEVIAEPQTAEASFFAYEESKPRQKNLIEQFTSQNCTYCPRGITLFSDLMEQRDDIAWVSVHGYMNGNDSFTTEESQAIVNYCGVPGYPYATYNRSFVPELAEGNEIAYGLGYNMNYRTQIVAMLSEVIDETATAPSFVTLNIAQEYNPTTRRLVATVDGEGVSNAANVLNGQGLFVYITENGVVARQLNEGKWVNNFTHHYALRKVLTNVTGDNIEWDGDNFSQQYTYDVPESYVAENLQIVAFVAPIVNAETPDLMNMAVNNCETANVETSTTGITYQSSDATATVSYNLNGVQLAAPQQGVNIVRMANGQVKKVVVK